MEKCSYQIVNQGESFDISDDAVLFNKSTILKIEKVSIEDTKFNCCESKSQTGCLIKFDDQEILLCHVHLFELLDLISEILNIVDKLLNAIAEINLYGLKITAETGSLIFLRTSLIDYLYELYKEHTEEEVFYSKSLSQKQIEFVKLFARKENKEKNKDEYLANLSKGEYQQYILKYNCAHRLQDCVHYCKRLSIPQNIAMDKPVLYLNAICSVRDITCKASNHRKKRAAVCVLRDFRNDTFSFSFCEDCLYDLYFVLKEPYLNDELEEYVYGDFKVCHKAIDDYCFFTGVKEERMFEVFLSNISFVLCKSSYQMLFKTVVSSSAFKELFPKDAKEFRDLITDEYIQQISALKKDINDLKRILDTEIRLKQKAKEQLTAKYNALLNQKSRECESALYSMELENEKLNKRVRVFKNDNKRLNQLYENLKTQNQELRNKIKSPDQLLQEEKNRLADEYRNKIVDCLKPGSIINLRLSKTSTNSENDQDLTYIYGIECSTFEHYPKIDLVVLLKCIKKREVCYFALCPTCVDILLYGLDFIERKKDNYFDYRYKLTIVFVYDKNKDSVSKSRQVRFTFGNVQFQISETQVKQFKVLLQSIKKKFELIKNIGGYGFLNDGMLNLK